MKEYTDSDLYCCADGVGDFADIEIGSIEVLVPAISSRNATVKSIYIKWVIKIWQLISQGASLRMICDIILPYSFGNLVKLTSYDLYPL